MATHRSLFQPQGCTAIVTGGGSGIGRALAHELVRRGAADVTVVDRDEGAATAVAAQIGGNARVVDVTSPEQLREAIEDTVARRGRLDLLCSNAGVLGEGLLDASEATWRQNLDVNLMAHVYAAQVAVPVMLEQGGGHLLQTISAAGLLVAPYAMPYTVSKHAALAFAESLAIHYGGAGLTVSCLCPQGVATPMLERDASTQMRRMMEEIGPLRSADDVAAQGLDGLSDGRFLILPHPEVQGYVEGRACDRDGWLRGIRRMIGR